MPDDSHKKQPKDLNHYPLWAPRFWHGMLFPAWWSMLRRHRFRVHPTRIPMACAVTGFTAANSALAKLQEWGYGKAVEQTPLDQSPIFIVGHWRSGTTFLHELMIRDPRHTFPTTYECFSPGHFLLTEKFVQKFMGFVLPAKRPMDNMPAGWDRPQEDEFALCGMGVRSPYLTMAFPNDPAEDLDYLDFENVDEAEIKEWQQSLKWFIQRVAYTRPQQRIVLKSPPHTSRLKEISELFPDARWVHMVRDPRSLVPSTMRLWKSLYTSQGFQVPHYDDLLEYVMRCYERMYARFEEQRTAIPENRLLDVRYEELVQEPLDQLQQIYAHLDLGDFEPAREPVQQYLDAQAAYQPNRHKLDLELESQIVNRWSDYMRRYGYDTASNTDSDKAAPSPASAEPR